jgi:N12 class adenine-specific DNA methylase
MAANPTDIQAPRSALRTVDTTTPAEPAAPAAPAWADVKARMLGDGLSSDQIEAGRNQYWAEVVAPKIPTNDLKPARVQFDADTASSFVGETVGALGRGMRAANSALSVLNGVGGVGSLQDAVSPRNQFDPVIEDAARANGIRPELLRSLVRAESGFDPKAKSAAGAMGLAQLMPGTAKEVGVDDPFDPVQSIYGGARYLRKMIDGAGDERLGVAAYNAGLGNVKKYGGIPPFKETQEYVAKVLGDNTESWAGRQKRYLGVDAHIAWNNLANTFDGWRASEFGDLLEAKKAQYGDRLNTDQEAQADYAKTKALYDAAIAETMRRSHDTAELMKVGRPATQTFLKEGGDWQDQLGNLLEGLREDPVGVVADLGIQSGPQLAAMMVSTLAAARAGLPPSAVLATGGSTSAMMNFGSEYADRIQAGEPHEQAYQNSLLKSGVIGLFDAVSLGSAGETMGRLAGVGLFRKGVDAAKELGRQAVLGGGGEAWGSYAAGEMPEVRDIGAEMAGEIAGAPFEMGGMRATALDKFGTELGRAVEQTDISGGTDAAARDRAEPVTIDLSGGPSAVSAAETSALPPAAAPAVASESEVSAKPSAEVSAAPAETATPGLNPEDYSPEEWAQIQALQAEPDVPDSKPAAPGERLIGKGKKKGRVKTPEEIDAAVLDGDLLNEQTGRPFETYEQAQTVQRGQNLGQHKITQLAHGAWVLRGPAQAPTSSPQGDVWDNAMEAPQWPERIVKPDGSLFAKKDGASAEIRRRKLNKADYEVRQEAGGGWYAERKVPAAGLESSPVVGDAKPTENAASAEARTSSPDIAPISSASAAQEATATTSEEAETDETGQERPGQETLLTESSSGVQGEGTGEFVPTHRLFDGQPVRESRWPDGRPVFSEWVNQAGEVLQGRADPIDKEAKGPGKKREVDPSAVSPVDDAAHEAATSPANDRPEPTPAQKEAGNYKKGHATIGGLDISIENPQGSARNGTDRTGKPWSIEMQHHYGYIKGTRGRDKDYVDVFVKPGTPENYSGMAYVIDQEDPETGRFDEHKALIGFGSGAEAFAAYHANYAKGWRGAGNLTEMDLDEFRTWVKDPEQTRKRVGGPSIRDSIHRMFSDEATPAAAEPAAETPELITRPDGSSFATKSAVSKAIRDGKLSKDDYEIWQDAKGGWYAQQRESLRKPAVTPPADSGQTETQDEDLGAFLDGIDLKAQAMRVLREKLPRTAGFFPLNPEKRTEHAINYSFSADGRHAHGDKKLTVEIHGRTATFSTQDLEQALAREEAPATPAAADETDKTEAAPKAAEAQVIKDSERAAAQTRLPVGTEIHSSGNAGGVNFIIRAWTPSGRASAQRVENGKPDGWNGIGHQLDLYERDGRLKEQSSLEWREDHNVSIVAPTAATDSDQPHTDTAPAASEAETDKPATAEARDIKQAARAAERAMFDAMLAESAVVNAVANTPENFRIEAERQMAEWIGARMLDAATAGDAITAKALDSLLHEGKPVLTDKFYAALFKEIKKRQKSTDNADKTQKARGKKLANTGVDLRRWFDAQSKKVGEMTDNDAIVAALTNATNRAKLFENVLAEDATPGAQRWMETLRNAVYPFKESLTANRHSLLNTTYGRYLGRNPKADLLISKYLGGEVYTAESREEGNSNTWPRERRVKALQDAASNYVDLVSKLVDALTGKRTVEELARAFGGLMAKPGTLRSYTYSSTETAQELFKVMRKMDQTVSMLAWPDAGPAAYSTLKEMIESETKDSGGVDKRAPLVPPKLDHITRDGEDYRKGKDIDPERFRISFEFAAVGFGKWVSAGRDQDHLNYAYDAFRDLAQFMEVDPSAMSLGKRLYFTIGALGHGKFAAHYSADHPHPDGGTVPVINVTNTRGDGTVAHEWAHALDLTRDATTPAVQKAIGQLKDALRYAYNIGVVEAGVDRMLRGESWWSGDKTAVKSRDGRIENAKKAIEYYAEQKHHTTAYYRAAQELDGGKAGGAEAYWSNDKELFARAFEGFVGDTLSHANTYLVNPEWSGEGRATKKTHRGTPYPIGEERQRFNALLAEFVKALRYDAGQSIIDLDREAWKAGDLMTDWRQQLKALEDSLDERMRKIEGEDQARVKARMDAARILPGDVIRIRNDARLSARDSSLIGREFVVKAPATAGDEISFHVEGLDYPVRAEWVELALTQAEREAIEQAKVHEAEEAAPPADEKDANAPLSVEELERLFDEAVAELAESRQEQPDAPAPGAPLDAVIAETEARAEASEPAPAKQAAPATRRTRSSPAVSDEAAEKAAADLAKKAAALGVQGVDEALQGLVKLFGGGPGKLLSFPGGIDEETYKAALPHFEAALSAFQEAGHTIKELFTFLIENFGAGIKPYAIRFAQEKALGLHLSHQPTREEAQGDAVNTANRIENPPSLDGMASEPSGGTQGNRDVGASGPQDGGTSPQDDAESDGPGVSRLGGGRDGAEGAGAAAAGGKSGGRGGSRTRGDGAGVSAGPGGTGAQGSGERRGRRSRVGESVSGAAGASGPSESDGGLIPGAAAQPNIPAANFVITDDVRLGKGGEVEKFNDNLAAIRALKRIEAENRRATPEEQRALARYVGWGGLANAFDDGQGNYKADWETRGQALAELLTPQEARTARGSTRNAHYTSQDVVGAVWQAVERLGFTGGLVLEPSAGVGNFIGLMPREARGNSHVLAVEYDSLTARIAKLLYPRATVLHSPFQKVPLPDGAFDLAIGNPPFGTEKLNFLHKPELNGRSIHNQFFLASLDALKPGGVQAMVVSRYLMDKAGTEDRLELARRADLAGAIRLPDTAFKENARTEVVTDILFLRRRTPEDQARIEEAVNELREIERDKKLKPHQRDEARRKWQALIPEWVGTTAVPDPLGGEPITVNRYFARRKDMMLGTLERSGSMKHDNDVTLRADKGVPLAQALAEAVEKLPRTAPESRSDQANAEAKRLFDAMAESLSLMLSGKEPGDLSTDQDGNLVQVVEREDERGGFSVSRRIITPESPWHSTLHLDDRGRWFTLEPRLDEKGAKIKGSGRLVYDRKHFAQESDLPAGLRLGKDAHERILTLVKLRDAFVRQVSLETEGAAETDIERNRAELRTLYESFTRKNGYINDPKNAKLLAEMPDEGLLMALELKYQPEITLAKSRRLGIKPRAATAMRAPILERRVTYPYQAKDAAGTPKEALIISLAETGRVDMPRIAKLLNVAEEAAPDLLVNDQGQPLVFLDPETQRWETADGYLSGNVRKKLEAARSLNAPRKNIAALEAVQPEPWGAEQVTPKLGANWIPEDVLADFLTHLLGGKATVRYLKLTNSYSVASTEAGSVKSRTDWGTDRVSAPVLLGHALNSTSPTVYDEDAEGNRKVNSEATREALLKLRAIHREFDDWAFANPDRRERLVKLFNDIYNTRVVRQFDGAHLELPGKVSDAVVRLRRHQTNAIWRGITERFMLIDHAVGAGKTFTAIARAMERRRLGLSRKPMIVVPNHMVAQFAADVYRLYPAARVLAATQDDLSQRNRRRMFGRIASGDWDVVIVPHSSFGYINISPDTELRYLDAELREAQAAVDEAWEQAKEDGTDQGWRKPFNVKEAEHLATNIETKIDKIRNAKADKLLTFEQLGVDDLTVDEAHEFKNLMYHSRLTSTVRGLGNKQGSKKAFDLWNKTRVIREMGGSTVFMTGTPISNSAVEMYLMMRYLIPEALADVGLSHFDAWRAQYVDVSTKFEPNESGTLKEVNRLGRSWGNMRDLMNMYYTFTDAVTNDDIQRWYKEDNDGREFPLPKVKSGGRRLIKRNPTPRQDALLQTILDGFAGLSGIQDIYERNRERLRLMDLARKLATDARVADRSLVGQTDEKGGKLDAVADEVTRLYRAWDQDKGTQLIFLDRSTPKGGGDSKAIKEYRKRLAARDKALADEDEEAFRNASEALEKYDPADMEATLEAQAGGWTAYQQIKDSLIARGIPAGEIRFIHEANTDEQKQSLFDMINSGDVRVLLGSTQRMGAGTNVQERLVGLHHVDVTWKPSDIEQREGRIIRQGNALLDRYGPQFEVEILAYATERTIDAKMWDLNATKLKMLNAIRKYAGEFNLDFLDEDSASMAEIAALASGNPLLLERVQLMGQIDELELAERSHRRRRFNLESQISRDKKILGETPTRIERLRAFKAELEPEIEAVESRARQRTVTVEGKTYGKQYDALKAATDAAEQKKKEWGKSTYVVEVGGQKLTSKEAIENAIDEALGDVVTFEATIGDKTFGARLHAGRKLAQIANEGADKIPRETANYTNRGPSLAVGSVYGLPLTLDLLRHGAAKEINADVSLTWHGETMASIRADSDKNGVFQAAALRRALSDAAETVKNKLARAPSSIEAYQEDMAAAEQELPELQEQLKAPFTQAAELKEKRQRLNEVTMELARDDRAKAIVEQADQDREMFSQNAAEPSGSTIHSVVQELARSGFASEVYTLVKRKRLKVVHSRLAPPGTPRTVSALWDGRRREAVLFYDRIRPGEVVGKVLHELGEHASFKVLLGDQYAAVVRDFEKLLAAGDPWAKRAAQRADSAVRNVFKYTRAVRALYRKDKSPEMRMALRRARRMLRSERRYRDSERLAYLIEMYANADAKSRETLPIRVRRFVRRLIAAVRAWFYLSPFYQAATAAGIEMNLSAADITALAREALRAQAALARREMEQAEIWSEPAGEPAMVGGMASAGEPKPSAGYNPDTQVAIQKWADDSDRPVSGDGQSLALGDPVGSTRVLPDAEHQAQAPESSSGSVTLGRLTGEFNPDISYSQADSEDALTEVDEAIKEQKSRFKTREDFVKAFRKLGKAARRQRLGLLTRDQLAEVSENLLPDILQRYLPLAQRVEADKSDIMQRVGTLIKNWSEFAQASPATARRLANLMHDATLAGVDPAVPYVPLIDLKAGLKQIAVLEAQIRGRSGESSSNKMEDIRRIKMQMKQEMKRRAAYDPLKETWDRLNSTAQRLYRSARDYHVWMSDEMLKALEDRIEDSKSSAKAKRQLIGELRKEFESNRVTAPYFPLARFGDYWVYTKSAGGDFAFDMFETREEQGDFIRQMDDEGVEVLGSGRQLERLHEIGGVSSGFVAEVEGMLGELGDNPLARQIRDGVWQLYLKTLPELSARRHFIHRRKTSGFSDDALRATAQKGFHDAYQIARLRHVYKMEGVIEDLHAMRELASSRGQTRRLEEDLAQYQEYQRERGNLTLNDIDKTLAQLRRREIDGDKSAELLADLRKWEQFRKWFKAAFNPAARIQEAERRLDGAARIRQAENGVDAATDYLAELQEFHREMLNPSGSWVSSVVNSFGFSWFLGAAISSALVNALQTPVIAMPTAAARYGTAATTQAFGRASREFFSTAKVNIATALAAEARHAKPGSAARRTAQQELRAYREFHRIGLLDKTLAFDTAGVAEEGLEYSGTRSRLMKVLAGGFHHAERMNREITAMATYRLARDKYLAEGVAADPAHEQAIADAARLTWQTHYNYSAANRARVMRGTGMRIVTQFKQYSQATTYFLLRSAHQAFKGATPGQRREARAQLGGVLAMQFLFAGARGLPIGLGVVALNLLAKVLDDEDDPFDWEAEVRQGLMDGFEKAGATEDWARRLGNFVWKGGVDAFTPISVADRISMSELWVRDPDRELEGKDETLFLLKAILGPMAGILENGVNGAQLIADGNIERGLEKFMPAALASLMKAGRYMDEGAKNLRGDALIEDVTAWEKIGQALGFTPSRLAALYERNNASKNSAKKLAERRQALLDRLAKTRLSGDTAEFEAARQEAAGFAEKNPDRAIHGRDVVQSVRKRNRRSALTEDGLYLEPKAGALRERYRF